MSSRWNRWAWTDLPWFIAAIVILIPFLFQLCRIVIAFITDVYGS